MTIHGTRRNGAHSATWPLADWATIQRTRRRYQIVRDFLDAPSHVVVGCCWREPAVMAAVLRVLWQHRRMRRALARRGVPAWITDESQRL